MRAVKGRYRRTIANTSTLSKQPDKLTPLTNHPRRTQAWAWLFVTNRDYSSQAGDRGHCRRAQKDVGQSSERPLRRHSRLRHTRRVIRRRMGASGQETAPRHRMPDRDSQ